MDCGYRICCRPTIGDKVKITSTCHEHDKCTPVDPVTYQAIIKKSHSAFHDISDDIKKLISFLIVSTKGKVDCATIRNLAERSLPKGMTMNPTQVYNLRKRIMAAVETDEAITSITELEDRIRQNDAKIWDHVDLFCNMNDDDACTHANELFNQLQGPHAKEHAFILEEYMKLLKAKDSSFLYDTFLNEHDEFVGCCWQTGHHRSNAERFGSYLSLDAMKRAINDLAWPYISITGTNELGKVCVMMESVIVDETEEAYTWLTRNLIKWTPRRPPSSYLIISGDGFFSQEIINRIGFTNAKFITDRWHLYENLKKNFGHLYEQVS